MNENTKYENPVNRTLKLNFKIIKSNFEKNLLGGTRVHNVVMLALSITA